MKLDKNIPLLLVLFSILIYMIKRASEGDLALQKMIDEGHPEHYQKEIKFIRKHVKEWVY